MERMDHPLLALVPPSGLPEAEQDEILRSAVALQSAGWSREQVDQAIRLAQSVAGVQLAHGMPLVICDDAGPFVAIRLPVVVGAREAIDMAQRLRALLETRGLDRAGLSISYWSIAAPPEHRPRRG
jgi:hypothetical protein